MRKTIILFSVLLIAGLSFSQTPVFDQSISIDQTFTTSTEIFPFNSQQINGAGINGTVTLNSDTSLIRIILKDSLTVEYMVFESHPLLDTIWNFTFSDECEETCFMDGFTPTSILIYLRGATVYLDDFVWCSSPLADPINLQMSSKQNKVSSKLDKIKSYIEKEHLIWKADFTNHSDLFYYEKLLNNAPSLESPGAEFYKKGIYAIKTPPPNGVYINYDYVPAFEWRSRHGANNPTSFYYDGDPDGGGWITGYNECQAGCFVDSVQDCSIPEWECDSPNVWKSTGLCWAFGPTAHIESLINLYLNDHADINLSEQNLSSCVRNFPWTHGWHTDEAYDYYRDDGVVNEQTFTFTGDSIDCIFPPPNEKIFINDYIFYDDYAGTALTEAEVRQNVMQNGPVCVSRYWFPYVEQGHARQLVGWDVVEWEDIYSFFPTEIPEDTASYAPWVGVTYWIYKDNYGSWKENNGFYYLHHWHELPPKRVYVVPTDNQDFVYSEFNTFNSTNVISVDNDGDGYYNWGIGPKPQNCPPCPDEPDSDDNNPGLGPMDEFGFSTIIGTYNSDFETSMNCWKQVDYDSCNWVKYNGESFGYPYSGPNGTPNGSTNYLLMYYGNCYHMHDAYIESPPIDLDDYCQIELTFAYHKNNELWGNPNPTSLAVDISYDQGQTWENDIWFIDDDQGDQWHYVTVYMPSDVTKIRFHGYFHYQFQHHNMALDDITISPVIETEPIAIGGNTEWSGEHVICTDIQVKAGATLTLLPGCEIKMFTDCKIVVERTAKLVVDNALITDNNNQLWRGIEVWGDKNKTQSYLHQGAVEVINGGTIENAMCGINTIKIVDNTVPPPEEGIPNYNYSGGMVLCDGAIFKNNRTAVKFWPYNYSTSASLFRNCQFISNDDMIEGTNPDYFIEMSDISGIIIAGGSFNDNHIVTNPDQLTSGIEAFDAGFKIWPFNGEPCLFTGLYDGIRVYSHDPSITVNIQDAKFSNNLRSAYFNGISAATITGNEFNPWEETVPISENSYCLYLDYCTDYIVEENDFNFEGSHPTGIGLVINNSGPYNNEVYNNTFTNLEYATLAENNNRGFLENQGLVIKCNDYWDNSQDIAVTAMLDYYPGIARNQGAEGSTDMQAGNLFSLNNNGISYSDYSTIKDSPITYYHHNPEGEPRVKPVYISKHITLDQQNNLYIEGESCPPSGSGGGGGGGTGDEELKGRMAESQFKADSTQAILTALVDGGDSDVLEQEVLQSMPPETYDLYMSLMGKSPYLSDSVLIAAIEKENVLSNVLIKDILVANPQAAKSNEVMEKVDEKSNPLDEELLAEVLLGQYIVAAKERLESNLAFYKHRRSTALKYLKQLYRNDTVNTWAHDSLIYLLENEYGLNEKYELVFEYIGMSNWPAAINLLDNLASLYSMNTQQQEIYQEMQQFTGLLFDLFQLDSTIYNMPGTQKSTLYDLADNSQNFVGSFARNILIETEGYEYTEPVILPEEGLKSGNIVFDLPDLKTFTPEHVKIYPNPALDYIIIELNTGNATGAVISLFDNQGKQIRIVNVPAHQQHYVLGLKDNPAGMYVVKVNCSGKILGSKKFSIVK